MKREAILVGISCIATTLAIFVIANAWPMLYHPAPTQATTIIEYSPVEQVAVGKLNDAVKAFESKDVETALSLANEVANDETLAADIRATGIALVGVCNMVEGNFDVAEQAFHKVLTTEGADPMDVQSAINGLNMIAEMKKQHHKANTVEI